MTALPILRAALHVNLDPRLVSRRAKLLGTLIVVDGMRFIDEDQLEAVREPQDGDGSEAGEIGYKPAIRRREAAWREALPHVGVVLEQVTGVPFADVTTRRCKKPHVYEAKCGLLWLMYMHDLSVAAQARLLDRDHSSILYAHARIGLATVNAAAAVRARWKVPEAAAKARDTAIQVQRALDSERGTRGTVRGAHHAIRFGALDGALCTIHPAAAWYVNWTLLGRPVGGYSDRLPVFIDPRVAAANPTTTAVHGVLLLARSPQLREVVEHALERAGLSPHAPRIRAHAARFGYAWAAAEATA